MPSRTSRRRFLKTSAVAGVGFWVASGLRARGAESPNDRIAMPA